MITIGERLRILRAKKNFSQEYMAEALGISRPAYVNYETNRTKPVISIAKHQLENREGERTMPDIVIVIDLSQLNLADIDADALA